MDAIYTLKMICMTSIAGALATTNMGYLVGGDADNPHMDHVYVDQARHLLSDRVALEMNRETIQKLARDRFSPERVLQLWDKHIFNEG